MADDVRRLKDEKPPSSHSIPSQPAPQGLLSAAGAWLLNKGTKLGLNPCRICIMSCSCFPQQTPLCPWAVTPSSSLAEAALGSTQAQTLQKQAGKDPLPCSRSQDLLTGTLSLHRQLLQEMRGLDQAWRHNRAGNALISFFLFISKSPVIFPALGSVRHFWSRALPSVLLADRGDRDQTRGGEVY